MTLFPVSPKPPTPQAIERLFSLHKTLTDRAFEIMESKNHDYRGGSDSDPYANFRGSTLLSIHPAIGILLRMQDKMMRVKTYVEKKQLKVQTKGDTLDDAVLDIINYSVLLLGMLTEDQND